MHVAKIMENHDTHGWLIAALLRQMSGLEGKAMFECVESGFVFNRCFAPGKRRSSTFVTENGHSDLGKKDE